MEFPLAGTGISFTGFSTLKSLYDFFPPCLGGREREELSKEEALMSCNPMERNRPATLCQQRNFPKNWEKQCWPSRHKTSLPPEARSITLKEERLPTTQEKLVLMNSSNETPRNQLEFCSCRFPAEQNQSQIRHLPTDNIPYTQHVFSVCWIPPALLFSAAACIEGCHPAAFPPALSWGKTRVGRVSASSVNLQLLPKTNPRLLSCPEEQAKFFSR